jgi:hypothetical protein
VSVKPEDLGWEARRAYDMWREVGLSESAAMQALRDDGVLARDAAARGAARSVDPERERLAEAFRELGLSEAVAGAAADGRDGPSRGSQSGVAESLSAVQAENARLIETVEHLAAAKRQQGVGVRRGETADQVALRSAAWAVIGKMPNPAMKLRVAMALEAKWPGVTGA